MLHCGRLSKAVFGRRRHTEKLEPKNTRTREINIANLKRKRVSLEEKALSCKTKLTYVSKRIEKTETANFGENGTELA